MSILNNIKLVKLDKSQYMNKDTEKKFQIFLHHTASSPNPQSVIDDWGRTPERIGTAFVIAGKKTTETSLWTDGEIYQCFGSQYWAWHLGLTEKHLQISNKHKSNEWLNKYSIGIELCNWGPLKQTSNGFQCWANKIVPDDEVIELNTPFKGSKFYQKYTEYQLDSARELILFLANKYNIPINYKGIEMFSPMKECVEGIPNLYFHTSCRNDKYDLYPSPELIKMLQSL